MKQTATLFLFLISIFALNAQNGNSICSNAVQICFENPITYPGTINAGPAEVGPNYGCLNTRPNPAWFYFQVGTPGDHQLFITNSENRDLDFIIYGPFATENNWCDSLTALNTADCSYAGGATETANFTSVTSGDYYVLMITNFANFATNVSVIQNAGTGTFSCDFVAPCIISSVTATASACDTLTNQYSVSGQVWSFYPPTTNTLNVSIGEQSVELSAPFTNPMTFNITGLSSNGATENILATFLANTSCTGSLTYTAPTGCIPCQATVTSNSPVCFGDTARIFTNFTGNATYQWSGPGFFTSFSQNPTFIIDSLNAEGNYSVVITGDNCAGERNIDIDIIQAPDAFITSVENEICEGEILFLSAANVANGNFSWTGPNGFTAPNRNAQVNNASPAASGDYIVSLNVNGCIGEPDTLSATVFSSPQITLTGPSTVNPQQASTVFEVTGTPGMVYFWNFLGNTTLISNVIYTSDKDTAVVFWDGGEGSLTAQVMGMDLNGCFSEDATLAIQVEIPTGINDLSVSNAIRLFPNPTNDKINFYVPSEDMEFRCMDLSGRTVLHRASLPAGNHEISLITLEAGSYLIELKNQYQQITSKLVIQH